MATQHMVSSTHYLASAAGDWVFRQGGNAIDAGVAAGLALNVVERNSCDFGGVAPIVTFTPSMEEPEVIDGVGAWPSGLTRAEHIALYGDDIPPGVGRAVTPGAPGGWLTALERHGMMSFEAVVTPALELAANGFPVHSRLSTAIHAQSDQLRKWPSSEQVFLQNGDALRTGDLLVQKELASTFKRLINVERSNSHLGRAAAIEAVLEYVYRGPLAEDVIDFIKEAGGRLTIDDMAKHRVSIERAERTTFRDSTIYSCGFWSQGPLVPMILNILEAARIESHEFGTPDFYHTVIEAIKLAVADREGFFGDPRQVDVPSTGMLEKQYASERKDLILEQASALLPLPGNPWRYAGRDGRPGFVPTPSTRETTNADTSYVCAVDAQGNAFSATPSDSGLESPLVPDLGFTVSTRGSQFWLDEEHPSVVAPQKRPRLTPNPGMALRNGVIQAVYGCPGGDAQTQAMVLFLLNIIDRGLTAQAAVEAPRAISMGFPESFFPHRYVPGRLVIEKNVGPAVLTGLQRRGHLIELQPKFADTTAAVCAIVRKGKKTPYLEGGADPRRDCCVVGW